MRRREFLTLLAAAATQPFVARAEQAERVPRIGVIGIGSAASSKRVTDALRQALSDLGYQEGKTILIEARFIDGNPDLAPALARELVDLRVDVIVAAGEAVYEARRVTATVPIVMAGSRDIVAQGFAHSLAHPGGNITGTIAVPGEVMAKRLEMLKQIVPTLRRAGVLLRKGVAANSYMLERMASIAEAVNLELRPFEASDAASYEAAFLSAAAASVGGFAVIENGQFYQDFGNHRLDRRETSAAHDRRVSHGCKRDAGGLQRRPNRNVAQRREIRRRDSQGRESRRHPH